MEKIINKLKHNTLFGILIGILLSGAIGVSAATYLYSSNQISYSNSNSSATDVKTALDELYETTINSKQDIYYLGTGTSFDIKTLLPDVDYTKLTVDNFIIPLGTSTLEGGFYDANGGVYIYFDGIGNKTANINITLSKAYDNQTGILTIANNTAALLLIGYSNNWNGSSYIRTNITPSVYLVMGEIQNT